MHSSTCTEVVGDVLASMLLVGVDDVSLLQVAQIFSLELTDVQDMQQCKQFVHSLLQDKSLLTPAVGLLLHFPVSTLLLGILCLPSRLVGFLYVKLQPNSKT